MKIAVMGAGAVGCYYGGLLARAGHEVRLIGRTRHVEAVARHGLLLETAGSSGRIPLAATTGADGVRDAELVLCCVKTSDTAPAAAAMRPHLAADAIVVSLQNGVDNPELLRAGLPQEIIPAAVYVATQMAGDGHVRHHGGGRLVLGDTPRAGRVAALFAGAGVPVPVFASSLSYFDTIRSPRLPAALIQGQRDFFGSHTYHRTDRPGTFHTLWAVEGRPEEQWD